MRSALSDLLLWLEQFIPARWLYPYKMLRVAPGAIFAAGLVLLSIQGVFVLAASIAATIVGLFVAPILAALHRMRQARLLSRVRALFVSAEAHLGHGRQTEAEQDLAALAELERQWGTGNSPLYLRTVTGLMFGSAYLFITIKYLLLIHLPHSSWIDTIAKIATTPIDLVAVIVFPLWFGVIALTIVGDLKERRWGDSYTEQLRRAIQSSRSLATAPTPRRRASSGNAARDLLGLPAAYSQADLRRAWLRLVRELHPDKWIAASTSVLRAKEEAMKRVNAARDELTSLAAGSPLSHVGRLS